MHGSFGGLHRIVLIMDRRGGTGEIVDFVNFDVEGKANIMAYQLKIGMPHQMSDIGFTPGVEIVHTQDLMPSFQELFTQVGAQKPSPTGYQYPLIKQVFHKASLPLMIRK
jgi:hypothetical protein